MPHGPTLLLIEDEPRIRRAVATALRDIAASVVEAGTATAGLVAAARTPPDLVLLDLALPDGAGLDVCRALRVFTTAPIVVLSASHSEAEKVALLEAGADDYVTKPFGTPELVARVRAQLRRARFSDAEQRDVIVLGALSIDLARRTVARDGAAVHLTPVEWNLLRVLALQPGRTLTHRQLFDAVWGQAFGDPRLHLRVHVTHLRRKIEPDPTLPTIIVTEPGVGYRCELPA